MKTSQAGLDFIKSWEKFRSKAYRDPGGVVTIGYGHTGDDVAMGDEWTLEQAIAQFDDDVSGFEMWVNRFVKVNLNQNQFDALVSFTYNAGPGNLQHSKLLRLVNASDFEGAADQFIRWNRQGGVVLAGLTARREAEKAIFIKE